MIVSSSWRLVTWSMGRRASPRKKVTTANGVRSEGSTTDAVPSECRWKNAPSTASISPSRPLNVPTPTLWRIDRSHGHAGPGRADSCPPHSGPMPLWPGPSSASRGSVRSLPRRFGVQVDAYREQCRPHGPDHPGVQRVQQFLPSDRVVAVEDVGRSLVPAVADLDPDLGVGLDVANIVSLVAVLGHDPERAVG